MRLQHRGVRFPDVDLEVVRAHQPRDRVLGQSLVAGLAWDAHQLLQRCDYFRSQRADRLSHERLDVSSSLHTTHAADSMLASPRRSWSGVTDNATRSRRMPFAAYSSHNSRHLV